MIGLKINFFCHYSTKTIPLEKLCHNLIVNSIQKGNSPCKHEFPEKRKDKYSIPIYQASLLSLHITAHTEYIE